MRNYTLIGSFLLGIGMVGMLDGIILVILLSGMVLLKRKRTVKGEAGTAGGWCCGAVSGDDR
ncbi:hypothetical protein [Paenibacillus sp. J2TS4]|uniref:hypothetical protein n=1 Tax=Paenibacillus sp. J2TS4 TaxID=2807194 RepID=UPI001B0CF7B9|nr:hypothetical protein [Paenibacillus sp. J2TS4]GIP34719.1 hypothetical protein J2TS4_39290 [Paenibacillus sp. J2TS4]